MEEFLLLCDPPSPFFQPGIFNFLREDNYFYRKNFQLKCYRSQGSAEESREEERTDEEAGHPPAQVLTQDPSQQAGWYGGESHQTC